MEDPIKIPTPYGGRLVWLLPGKNRLIVHMKDKNLIRHKKRWSQVDCLKGKFVRWKDSSLGYVYVLFVIV